MSENNNLTPKKLAFITDNLVVDVLDTDERLAAILLSQPLVLELTEEYEEVNSRIGNVYDESTQKFMPPSPGPEYIWNEDLKGWVIREIFATLEP
jgi:hypothetical protein